MRLRSALVVGVVLLVTVVVASTSRRRHERPAPNVRILRRRRPSELTRPHDNRAPGTSSPVTVDPARGGHVFHGSRPPPRRRRRLSRPSPSDVRPRPRPEDDHGGKAKGKATKASSAPTRKPGAPPGQRFHDNADERRPLASVRNLSHHEAPVTDHAHDHPPRTVAAHHVHHPAPPAAHYDAATRDAPAASHHHGKFHRRRSLRPPTTTQASVDHRADVVHHADP